MVAAQPGQVGVVEPVISVPAIVTVPLVGLSSPARMCMSVDLPEPDGPMTATRWPCAHLERNAAQRVDGRVALAVLALQIAGAYDDPVQ